MFQKETNNTCFLQVYWAELADQEVSQALKPTQERVWDLLSWSTGWNTSIIPLWQHWVWLSHLKHISGLYLKACSLLLASWPDIMHSWHSFSQDFCLSDNGNLFFGWIHWQKPPSSTSYFIAFLHFWMPPGAINWLANCHHSSSLENCLPLLYKNPSNCLMQTELSHYLGDVNATSLNRCYLTYLAASSTISPFCLPSDEWPWEYSWIWSEVTPFTEPCIILYVNILDINI